MPPQLLCSQTSQDMCGHCQLMTLFLTIMNLTVATVCFQIPWHTLLFKVVRVDAGPPGWGGGLKAIKATVVLLPCPPAQRVKGQISAPARGVGPPPALQTSTPGPRPWAACGGRSSGCASHTRGSSTPSRRRCGGSGRRRGARPTDHRGGNPGARPLGCPACPATPIKHKIRCTTELQQN